MDKEEFKQKFGRLIEPNEVVFDFDDREKGFEAINFTGINLYSANYKFEIWYAQGQKSPHLHIKDIHYLETLTPEQLKKYKELLLLNYSPESYKQFLDLKLATRHRIAEENKPHYKYTTIKELCGVWNADKENYAEKELVEKAKKEESGERKIEVTSGITNQIVQKVSIIEIAKRVTQVKGNKAICPFHADTNPSMSLNDSRGLFYCFGCNAKGNLVDFLYLIKTKLGIPIENVL